MKENSPKRSILITTSNLDHGGVEEVILEYTKKIDRDRYSVSVACLKGGRVAEEIASQQAATVVTIASRGRIGRFFGFWRTARMVRPAIVHNHACWYGLIIGFLIGARRVETIHNMYHWFKPHERILYGLYCLLADRIIAVSEFVRSYTLDAFPFMRKNRFVVVYNGIDTGKFGADSDGNSLRSELGLAAADTVVGFIGRLTEQKGAGYLLEAAADETLRTAGLKFVIVGEGELLPALEKKKNDLGLTNVIFTGFRRDVPRLLSLFDVYVLPSLWEGLPVGVLEASAAGCPVVATRVSGTAEVVVDGTTGFLIEPKNIRELAVKIALLSGDPELRKKMGEAGRERILQNFTSVKMVRETEKIYREILGES